MVTPQIHSTTEYVIFLKRKLTFIMKHPWVFHKEHMHVSIPSFKYSLSFMYSVYKNLDSSIIL